jgi:hypothetical protein
MVGHHEFDSLPAEQSFAAELTFVGQHLRKVEVVIDSPNKTRTPEFNSRWLSEHTVGTGVVDSYHVACG